MSASSASSESVPTGPEAGLASGFRYEDAFARNLGLIGPAEQARLRSARVAIAGLGGVGGIHLATLARMGVGRFTIADPDSFEPANINRQYGATSRGFGRNKAEVMADEALAISPELDLRVLAEPIGPANIDHFLDGADLYLDGIDFFALDVRRLIFREARRRGIWAITAGPIGFSAAWLAFAPDGMSFDDYFDVRDGMDHLDGLVAFLAGLTPRATQAPYMDFSQVDTSAGRGPSVALACQLCAGVAAAEAVKVLLGRPGLRPVPWFFQFDAYRHKLARGYLWMGNRNPWQRFKRRVLRRRLEQMGWGRPRP